MEPSRRLPSNHWPKQSGSGSEGRHYTNKPTTIWLLAALVIISISCPSTSLATQTTTASQLSGNDAAINWFNLFRVDSVLAAVNIDQPAPAPAAPTMPLYTITAAQTRVVTAYNVGDPNQCDGNPCVAANGENICLALRLGYKRCAANFVPFGTTLEIEGYGRCLVTDRTHPKYGDRVDIAMPADQKVEALRFGRQTLTIKILAPVDPDNANN